jgi:hypothetical protein
VKFLPDINTNAAQLWCNFRNKFEVIKLLVVPRWMLIQLRLTGAEKFQAGEFWKVIFPSCIESRLLAIEEPIPLGVKHNLLEHGIEVIWQGKRDKYSAYHEERGLNSLTSLKFMVCEITKPYRFLSYVNTPNNEKSPRKGVEAYHCRGCCSADWWKKL